MKSLTGSLFGAAFSLGLFVPVHGAAAQWNCAEGSSEERVACLVQLVTDLRVEMQRGVADLTIESQRLEGKFDTDLRDSKRVIQENIVGLSGRIDSLEIQLGAGFEEAKSEIAGLGAGLAEAKSEIAGLGGGLAEAKSGIAGLGGGLAEAKSGIAGLGGGLEEVKSEIAGLRASGSLEAIRTEIQNLKGDIGALKQNVASGATATDVLRQEIDSGVTNLTDDIQKILTEIQNREASFLATVEGLEVRLDRLSKQSGATSFNFGSGGSDSFGEQNTLLLDVTRNSVVFVTVRARVSSLSGGELTVTPEAAQHQKCDGQSVGPRVGRNVIVSCTFGGLDSGTITIAGGDPRGENSYSYFVLTPK